MVCLSIVLAHRRSRDVLLVYTNSTVQYVHRSSSRARSSNERFADPTVRPTVRPTGRAMRLRILRLLWCRGADKAWSRVEFVGFNLLSCLQEPAPS